MNAAELSVAPAGLLDVIDFDAVRFSQRTVVGRSALGRAFAATLATILIAALCRATRERPPVIGPKGVRTFVAAPRSPTLGKIAAAPFATIAQRMRERAGVD